MGPKLQKVALTAHVMASVGWLGAAFAFLVLAIISATSVDQSLVRATFRAMEPMMNLVIVPLAIASLVTGVTQALGTRWGLLSHYWVVIKLLLTLFATVVLIDYTATVSSAAAQVTNSALSSSELQALSGPPILHASGGLVVLTIITVLSIFKPTGLTRYGQRKRRATRQQQPQD